MNGSWLLVAAAMFLGLAVRLAIIARTSIQAKDAYYYVDVATLLASGDIEGWRFWAAPLPPLYTEAMAVLIRCGMSGVAAGIAISVVTSLALTPLVFLVGREFFGTRAAVLAAGLYATHPMIARYSVEVLRDSLFLCLFLWAVWLAYRGLATGRLACWAGSGALAGLAICTRKEAWALPITLLVFVGYSSVRRRGREIRGRLFGLGLAATVMFLAVTPFHRLMTGRGATWHPVDTVVLRTYIRHGWWRDADKVKELQD